MGNFYEYQQNNSGGAWDFCDKICHRVIIEADNIEEANKIALSFGIYFDGCKKGIDCYCCGDRWGEPYKEMQFPMNFSSSITFANIDEYAEYITKNYGWDVKNVPDTRIFYKNGEVKGF